MVSAWQLVSAPGTAVLARFAHRSSMADNYRGDLHMWINNIALDDEHHRSTMPHTVTLLRKLHAMATELSGACPAFAHAHTQTQVNTALQQHCAELA